MNTNFESIPALLRSIIARYLENPEAFNFMETKNEIWVKIHKNLYSIKLFILDDKQFSQKIKSIDGSHDLWISYELNRFLGEIFLNANKAVQGLQLDFQYSEDRIFVIKFSVQYKKPNTIFDISEENTEQWINEKLLGDYGKLYKIIKENYPIDLSTLIHKSRFVDTETRNEFLKKMLSDNLIAEEFLTGTAKKRKKIFMINENKMIENAALMPDMPEDFRFETDDTPMPDRFYETYEKEKKVREKIRKQKEIRHQISERNVKFHETTMMQTLFQIAGKAIEHVHKLFPKLMYVVKITMQDGSYDVMEFKAKKHTITFVEYFDEGFPVDLKQYVIQSPYKPFIYGYLEYVRAAHSDFEQASLYDGSHVINSKEVYVEIDFKESSVHKTEDILNSLPEKIEQYFNNTEAEA